MFACRSFSPLLGRVSSSLRYNSVKAFPQYNVFSEQCMLSLKLLPPVFKYLRNTQTLIVDGNKKGRLLLEWIPKNPDGTISRDRVSSARFGLSAEEIGLILYQIPQKEAVEFVRKPAPNESLHDGPSAPHKVCKITPAEHTVEFTIDFEVDGVGGQMLQSLQGPQTVTMQAGEWQVASEIMRTSLPTLVGWSNMQALAMEKVVNEAKNDGGSGPPNDPFGFQ